MRIVPSGRSLLHQSVEVPEAQTAFLGAGLTDFGPFDPELCGTGPDRNAEGGLCPFKTPVSEVTRIENLFRDANLTVQLSLIEDNATEEAVTQAMPGTRFIHLATHGGEQLAGYSGEGLHNVGLAFHGIGGATNESRIVTPANDGILSGYEAARLQLWGTDLVVMSACDTALGEEAGAEGIWSMAYAFRLAGTNAVMMTLWAVDDETAPDFMARFYSNLFKRQSQSPEDSIKTVMRNALRNTQLWAISEGWSYWKYGPYVLVES